MRVFARVSVAGLLCVAAFSQVYTALPAFEIADIHASAHIWNPVMQGGILRAGRYELRQATMLDLIRTAYGVDTDTVFGGPAWLDWDRFDVVAKAPPATSPETVRLMLQRLLADRFKLVIHRDIKPMSGLVLTAGKAKPKLKEAAEDPGSTGCQAQPPPRPDPDVVPYIGASCRGVTMAEFAAILRDLSSEYVAGPVVDSTGLKGAWDFDLKWTSKGPLAAGRGGISLFEAVDRELGLRLQSQKIPMAVIVVESVNQKPSENPPGAGALLSPSSPAEFEVASIKPSRDDTPPPPPAAARQIQPGGRINWIGVPLRALITQAWDLDPDPHAEIAGAPKWLDSARFDLVAKAPAEATANGRQIFSDDLRMMLRALLVDRFGMETHFEERPVDAYTLVSAKPKLKKADPANRPGCKIGPPQPPRDPGQGPPPLVTVCENVTMAQFADRLQDIARSYIRYPVLDATGIEGSWDFTLSFRPAPPPAGGPGRGAPKGGPPPLGPGPEGDMAADPAGSISLFGAVEKQLGLKLQPHKRPMPVVVIDHIEQKPTDN
jgi:uncharacterized protein (TIGR03435 family)